MRAPSSNHRPDDKATSRRHDNHTFGKLARRAITFRALVRRRGTMTDRSAGKGPTAPSIGRSHGVACKPQEPYACHRKQAWPLHHHRKAHPKLTAGTRPLVRRRRPAPRVPNRRVLRHEAGFSACRRATRTRERIGDGSKPSHELQAAQGSRGVAELFGLGLEIVQIGDGALRMCGCREDEALVIGQHGKPACQVRRVVRPGLQLGHDAKVSA